MLIVSCHADTNFHFHSLDRKELEYKGFLDNFAGVYAVMRAYFSGRIQGNHVRIVLTDEEETTMGGAMTVRDQIHPDDFVVVVDVTGIVGEWDFTVEKCRDPETRAFVERSLAGFKYRLFEDSPDPIASEDEVDVYVEKCRRTIFLGLPCSGGDYNREPVTCKESSIQAVADALAALCMNYSKSSLNQL